MFRLYKGFFKISLPGVVLNECAVNIIHIRTSPETFMNEALMDSGVFLMLFSKLCRRTLQESLEIKI